MSAFALSSAEIGIPSIERRLGCLNTKSGLCISLRATWRDEMEDYQHVGCGDLRDLLGVSQEISWDAAG